MVNVLGLAVFCSLVFWLVFALTFFGGFSAFAAAGFALLAALAAGAILLWRNKKGG